MSTDSQKRHAELLKKQRQEQAECARLVNKTLFYAAIASLVIVGYMIATGTGLMGPGV